MLWSNPHICLQSHIRWYHSCSNTRLSQRCVALQPSEEAQRLMFASSGPRARVVRRNPRLLMILTWSTRDVHHAICLISTSLGWMVSCHYTYEREFPELSVLIRLSFITQSPSGCVYITSMSWFNQWDYKKIFSLKPGRSHRRRSHMKERLGYGLSEKTNIQNAVLYFSIKYTDQPYTLFKLIKWYGSFSHLSSNPQGGEENFLHPKADRFLTRGPRETPDIPARHHPQCYVKTKRETEGDEGGGGERKET